jgi:hypothetical protein
MPVAALGPIYLLYAQAYRHWVSRGPETPGPESPVRRMIRAILLSYLWFLCVCIVETSNVLCGVPGFVMGVISVVYMCQDTNRWWSLRNERWRYLQINPDPKFQIWMQDLIVFAFGVGFVMLAWRQFVPVVDGDGATVLVLLFLNAGLAQLLTFLAVLDAMRFAPRMTPWMRLRTVALLLLISGLLPCVPCVVVSWMAWRRALWIDRLGGTQRIISFG